jgi:hypothetical protein
METIKLVGWIIFLATLSASVHKNHSITIEPVYTIARIDGNTSLPDPGPINAFLRSTSNDSNPLMEPLMQLQVCKSSIFSIPFDFYVIQHPRGCESPPLRMVRKSRSELSKRDRLIDELKLVCEVWALTVLGLFFFALLVGGFVNYFKCCSQGWTYFSGSRDRRWGMAVFVATASSASLYGAILPACVYVGEGLKKMKLWRPAHTLPDPVMLSQILSSSSLNVTLHLCEIKEMYEVYLGFADSCDQVASSLYPQADISMPKPLGPAMLLLQGFAAFITFGSWIFLLAVAVYGSFRCGPRCYGKLKDKFGHRRRQV